MDTDRPGRMSFRGRWGAIRRETFLLDAALATLALVAARISTEITKGVPVPIVWLVATLVFTLISLNAARANRPRFVLHFLDDLRAIVGATAIAAMLVSFARLLLDSEPDIAGQASRLWLFSVTYAPLGPLQRSDANRAKTRK